MVYVMGVENDFETQPERSGAEGGKGLFVERGKKKGSWNGERGCKAVQSAGPREAK